MSVCERYNHCLVPGNRQKIEEWMIIRSTSRIGVPCGPFWRCLLTQEDRKKRERRYAGSLGPNFGSSSWSKRKSRELKAPIIREKKVCPNKGSICEGAKQESCRPPAKKAEQLARTPKSHLKNQAAASRRQATRNSGSKKSGRQEQHQAAAVRNAAKNSSVQNVSHQEQMQETSSRVARY